MNSKRNFHLIENEKFFIAQITSALPSSWKQSLGNYTENINSLVIQKLNNYGTGSDNTFHNL